MILYNFYGLAGLITFLSYTAVKRGVEQNCDITYFTNFLLHYRLNFNPYEKAFSFFRHACMRNVLNRNINRLLNHEIFAMTKTPYVCPMIYKEVQGQISCCCFISVTILFHSNSFLRHC